MHRDLATDPTHPLLGGGLVYGMVIQHEHCIWECQNQCVT